MDDSRPAPHPYLPEDEERLRRDTDAAVRLYGEFLRRLSHQGVRGVGDLGRLLDQLRRAVDSVALPEIDYALAQIGAVIDRLRLIGGRLDRLAGMKAELSAAPRDGDGREPGLD